MSDVKDTHELDRKKKIILIGRSTCGKTTLTQRITQREMKYVKTQALNFVDSFIYDTPGEYLENRAFRGAITVTSTEADVVVFVKDATVEMSLFPPSFSSLFLGKPVIGVVTKIDIATEEQIKDSVDSLKLAGATKVFEVSSYTGEGIRDFMVEIGMPVGDEQLEVENKTGLKKSEVN